VAVAAPTTVGIAEAAATEFRSVLIVSRPRLAAASIFFYERITFRN
jgi:hypothetical protein